MKDIGALGYNKRNVRIIQLVTIFQWVTEVDLNDIDANLWYEVNEDINELGLKYP